MKKIFTILFMLAFIVGINRTQAQIQFGTGINFGYGCGAAIQEVNSNYNSDSSGAFTDEGIYASYGAGLHGALLLQAKICNMGDAELNIGGFKGKKITYTDYESYGDGDYFSETGTEGACGWFLEPMVRLHTVNEGKCNFYARQGVHVGVGIKNKFSGTTINNYGTFYNNTTEWSGVERGNIALGYTGELGASYAPNDNYEFNLGVYYRGVNVSWKSSSLETYSQTITTQIGTLVSGIDSLDENQREVLYQRTITDKDNEDPDKPSVQLQEFKPYSSYGIRIGFIYQFGAAQNR